MSLGITNLSSNPGFIGGIVQDPTSLSETTDLPLTGDDVRKCTNSGGVSANNYAAQCYTNFTQETDHTSKAACEVANTRVWRKAAYGTITLNKYPDKLSIGDELEFATSVTANNYVTSKRTIFTLTATHAGGNNNAVTLTGTFNCPIAENEIAFLHRRYLPAFINWPVNPKLERNKTTSFVVQTNITGNHDYHGGGFDFRWCMTTDLEKAGPKSMGGYISSSSLKNFQYSVLRKPFVHVYSATDTNNGKGRDGDIMSDIINVNAPANATTCVMDVANPTPAKLAQIGLDRVDALKRGTWWWCEVRVFSQNGNNYITEQIIRTPTWFLEVTGFD